MAQEWVEVLARRNRTSKTKQLYVDGEPTLKYSWDGQVGRSMHYVDAQGAWQDVDESVEEPDTDGFTVKFTKLSYFGRIDGEGRRRFYPDRNDLSYWIEFKKPYPNMGAPTRHNRWFYWNFAHAIIGVRFDVDRLKFGFRLKDAQAPTSITIPFETQGITRQGRLLLHDGEPVAILRRPIATGSNLIEKECDVVFGPGQVTISLDPTGLEYPIEIDPTVDKQVAATADDGSVNAVTEDFYTTAYSNAMGNEKRDGFYWDDHHSFFRWIGVSIEGTIDVSYISCYSTYYDGSGQKLKVRGVDEDNPAAPTSYSEFTSDPLTTAGVDWDGAWNPIYAWYNSPSLNTIFQELVDSYTISNDAVMVQVKDDDSSMGNYNRARDYTHTAAQSPKLHIEYTAAGGSDAAAWIAVHRMRSRNILLRM